MATKPHRWAVLVGTAALALAACSSGSGVKVVSVDPSATTPDAGSTASSSTPASTTAGTTGTTAAAATTTTESVTSEPATTDSTPPGTVPGHDPDSLLPMGDPKASTFTYESSFSGVTWAGYLAAVVQPAKDEYNEDDGSCVVLLGTVTPTALETGAVSPGYDVPTMSLVAAGEQIDSTGFECDVADIEAAGYRSTSYAALTVGTSFPFYVEFFIPGTGTPKLDSIVVGDPTEDGATYFAPTVATAIPAPPAGTIGTFDEQLAPTGDPSASTITYASPYDGTDWSGVVLGATESPLSEFTEATGRCVTVYGVVTPTKLDQGVVSTGFDTPTVSVIAGGRSIDSGFQCDPTEIEAAGYQDLYGASVTVGTSYAFYRQFLVEGDPTGTTPATTLEAIGVGDTTTDDAQYFVPTVTATIAPPPAPTVGPLGQALVPTDDPTKAVFTYTDPYASSGTTWSGTVQGLVDTPFVEFTDATGRCLVLVGSITPTAIQDGSVTEGYDAPPLSIIANGRLIDSTGYDCDTTAIEAAGYHSETDAAVTVGTKYLYSVGFVVTDPATPLDAIVVGDPTGDDAVYFTPLVLPAVPTGG